MVHLVEVAEVVVDDDDIAIGGMLLMMMGINVGAYVGAGTK